MAEVDETSTNLFASFYVYLYGKEIKRKLKRLELRIYRVTD